MSFADDTVASLRAAVDLVNTAEEPDTLTTVAELDAKLRPLGDTELDLPRRLRRKKVDGKIVLELEVNTSGEVVELRVASSDLPDFESCISEQVRGWKFTPPTRGGLPVEARTRLPIAITLN